VDWSRVARERPATAMNAARMLIAMSTPLMSDQPG
jgi:hypothetical protein